MGQKSERTNMASEFYVLSTLHRLGLEPVLTLGNKKSIDIIVQKANKTLTIDVKGIQRKISWLLGKNKPEIKYNHYYALVTYLNKIGDITSRPECYIVPAKYIHKFIKKTKKGYSIRYCIMRDKGKAYKERWSTFI